MKKPESYINKIGSRKFQVLLIGIVLFLLKPMAFTGDHVVILMSVYMGVNVAGKFANNNRGEE